MSDEFWHSKYLNNYRVLSRLLKFAIFENVQLKIFTSILFRRDEIYCFFNIFINKTQYVVKVGYSYTINI